MNAKGTRFEYLFSAFRLMHDISSIVQPVVMTVFTWSLISICDAMLLFMMQISHDSNNIIASTVPFYQFFWAFTPVAVACELCGRMCDGYDEVCNEIMKFKWYLFPLKTRKILLIIMPNAQKPVRFECFGSISCNRNTLKKVWKEKKVSISNEQLN